MKITQSNIDLLIEMIKTDFKLRYHGSILGFIWVLLKPLIQFLIFYIIFSYIFSKNIQFFALRLILGLIIFSYFSEGTSHGLSSLISKAHIILKVNFPRQITVIASIINSFLTLIISFVIFMFFWLITPTSISLLWLLFPLYIIILTVLIIGISFYTSIIAVRFRDLQNIWELLMQLIFYCSAIFYPISILPNALQKIIFFNPIFIIIYQSQQILIDNQTPDLKLFAYVSIISILIFFTGYIFFNKKIARIAEYF